MDQINMLWVKGPLPWYALASVKSFIFHGHEVILYTYTPEEITPIPGCRIQDAEEILSSDKIFVYRDGVMKGHLSGFADWFRYELLLAKGGWWSDSDMICTKPFEANASYIFASAWEAEYPRYEVNNNVIYVNKPDSRNYETSCANMQRTQGYSRARRDRAGALAAARY